MNSIIIEGKFSSSLSEGQQRWLGDWQNSEAAMNVLLPMFRLTQRFVKQSRSVIIVFICSSRIAFPTSCHGKPLQLSLLFLEEGPLHAARMSLRGGRHARTLWQPVVLLLCLLVLSADPHLRLPHLINLITPIRHVLGRLGGPTALLYCPRTLYGQARRLSL